MRIYLDFCVINISLLGVMRLEFKEEYLDYATIMWDILLILNMYLKLICSYWTRRYEKERHHCCASPFHRHSLFIFQCLFFVTGVKGSEDDECWNTSRTLCGEYGYIILSSFSDFLLGRFFNFSRSSFGLVEHRFSRFIRHSIS